MIIALKKELEVGSTGLIINHWIVNRVVNNVLNNFARINIIGYASKEDRLAGKDMVLGANYDYIIENIPEVLGADGVTVITPANNEYNKFNNYSLSVEESLKHPDPKQRHFLKYATLSYLRNIPDFDGATEE